MENMGNLTVKKLMTSFSQFRKTNWNPTPISGLKPSEIMLMFCVRKGIQAESSGMKVSEISSHLNVTSPTITQLINGLEEQGFVERDMDPEDRRAVRIKLTKQGEFVAKEAAAGFYSTFHGLVEYLGEEKSTELAELLTMVTVYFNESEKSKAKHLHSTGDDLR